MANALCGVVPNGKALELFSLQSSQTSSSCPSPVQSEYASTSHNAMILTTLMLTHSLMDPTATAFVPQPENSASIVSSGSLFPLTSVTWYTA